MTPSRLKTKFFVLIFLSVLFVILFTIISHTTESFRFLGRRQTVLQKLSVSRPIHLRDVTVLFPSKTITSLTLTETNTSGQHMTNRKLYTAVSTTSRQAKTGKTISVTKQHTNATSMSKQGKTKAGGNSPEVRQNYPNKNVDRPPKEEEEDKEDVTRKFPQKLRLKFEKALSWNGAPIPKGHPHWQTLDSNFTAFVYSAHYDDVSFPPLIRIVGFAHGSLPFLDVTCHFYDRHLGPAQDSVSGTLYHFRHKERNYVGAFVDCPLPKTDNSLPFAVSVSKGDDSVETLNYLIIHYSQKDPRLEDNFYPVTANNETIAEENNSPTVKDNSNRTIDVSNNSSAKGDNWRWTITRCFPAFQDKYNKHLLLAEMVAASKVLGVQRFVFYVRSAGPDVLRMLKVLEEEGLAEVYPWNMHLSDEDLFYFGQFPAIQDCLYRHLHSSRYLLFGDVDELFVPRQSTSLMPLLQNVFEKSPECATFLFLHTAYNLHFPTHKPPSNLDPAGFAPAHNLTMLTHVRREKKIWSPQVRSKPAVDPRKVKTGSVHVIETERKGFKICTLDSGLGLLHHYREFEVPAPELQKDDPYLWRFAEDIIGDVKTFLERSNNVNDQPYP